MIAWDGIIVMHIFIIIMISWFILNCGDHFELSFNKLTIIEIIIAGIVLLFVVFFIQFVATLYKLNIYFYF